MDISQKERVKLKSLIINELMKNSDEIRDIIQPKRKHITNDPNIKISIGPIDRPDKPYIIPGSTSFFN